MRTRGPPNTANTSENDQTGRITPASTKCLLCGIPHNRHSFAVRTLLDAYRTDGDPAARIAALSTYLGHVDPGESYWYLEAAPELMELAGERLERHLGGGR